VWAAAAQVSTAARAGRDVSAVRSLRRDLGVAAVVVVAVVLVQMPLRLVGVNPMDEGGVLQFSADLLRGRHLYADVAVYAFPGVFWLTAGIFHVFGTTIEVARMAAAVVFGLLCGVVYLLARWSHGPRGAIAIVLAMIVYRVWAFPHWQMLNYSSLAVLFALAATWATGEGLARERTAALVAGGALAAAAILAKQDSGGTTAILLGLAVLALGPAGRVRRAVAFASGGALVLGAAAAYLVATGTFGDLVREAVLAPLNGARTFEYLGRPALLPLAGRDAALRRHVLSYAPPILLDTYGVTFFQSALYRQTAVLDALLKVFYYAPWAVVLAALPGLRRRQGRAPRAVLLLVQTVAFLVAFNLPHDWAHLVVFYPAVLLLAAQVLAPLARWRVVRGLAWTGLAGATAASLLVVRDFAAAYATPVHAPAGTLYTRPGLAQPLQEALDRIAATPASAPLASLPYYPLLDFLALRAGVTRHYIVWPAGPASDRDQEVIADLERHPDAVVVYNANEFPQFPRFREYAPRLFAHLIDAYEIDRVFGGDPGGATIILLRRRPPAAESRSLLGDAFAHADVTASPPTSPPPVLAREVQWPFEHVLAMSTVPGGAVTVRYPLTASAGDHFQAACGIDPERFGETWLPPVRCRVVIERGEGAPVDAAHVDLDPLRRPEDRRWVPIDVDLTPWAGTPIGLVLRLEGAAGAPPDPNLAGWAAPRITSVRAP